MYTQRFYLILYPSTNRNEQIPTGYIQSRFPQSVKPKCHFYAILIFRYLKKAKCTYFSAFPFLIMSSLRVFFHFALIQSGSHVNPTFPLKFRISCIRRPFTAPLMSRVNNLDNEQRVSFRNRSTHESDIQHHSERISSLSPNAAH